MIVTGTLPDKAGCSGHEERLGLGSGNAEEAHEAVLEVIRGVTEHNLAADPHPDSRFRALDPRLNHPGASP